MALSRFENSDDFYINQELFSEDDEVNEYVQYRITTIETPDGQRSYNVLRLGQSPISWNNLSFVASFTDSACHVSRNYLGYQGTKPTYTVSMTGTEFSFEGFSDDDDRRLAHRAGVSFSDDDASEALKVGMFMLSLACKGLCKRHAEARGDGSGDGEDTNMIGSDKISEDMKDLGVDGMAEGDGTKVGRVAH